MSGLLSGWIYGFLTGFRIYLIYNHKERAPGNNHPALPTRYIRNL
jgi:hypothetical protein